MQLQLTYDHNQSERFTKLFQDRRAFWKTEFLIAFQYDEITDQDVFCFDPLVPMIYCMN